MKLLAIETSTIACSAALSLDGEVRERYELAPRRHADLLLPMIDELLADAGVAIGALDAIAFARGPGAFTGLRIAASVAQGVAWAAALPVVPVSTLAALAQGAVADGLVDDLTGRVLAVMDARMAEVYWGAYRAMDGIVRPYGDECVCAPSAVPVPEGEGWFGVGDGWSAYGALLDERLGTRVAGRDAARYPRARDVAALAAYHYAAHGAVPPEQALPVYLRDRVASPPAPRG